MRRAARTDANQENIVKSLRALGATVRFLSQGEGIPDLLVGFKGKTFLLEVKDGEKPPSARKLTPPEQKFFDEWRGGSLAIVNSVDEAIAVVLGMG